MKPLHEIAMAPDVLVGEIGEDGMWFRYPSIDWRKLHVLVSNGLGWDHVSVSRLDRAPTWYEMELVRKLCFLPHETVMQLHVPGERHINIHEHCLHLWRPQDQPIPTPPLELV